MADFNGKVILITGAAQGLGAEMARNLASQGAILALADIKAQDDWKHNLGKDDRHSRHTLNIRDMDACTAAVAEIQVRHGRLDCLVNNAGIVSRGSAEEMSVESFTTVIDVNLNGTFRMSKAAFEMLRESDGRIVNIGSTSGKLATPESVSYCASKAAIHHLTSALALDWAKFGILVNAVAPIIVPTAMNADLRSSEEYLEQKLARIPLRRMATECEIAEVVSFLLSDAARMITGQTLYVDGGATFN